MYRWHIIAGDPPIYFGNVMNLSLSVSLIYIRAHVYHLKHTHVLHYFKHSVCVCVCVIGSALMFTVRRLDRRHSLVVHSFVLLLLLLLFRRLYRPLRDAIVTFYNNICYNIIYITVCCEFIFI